MSLRNGRTLKKIKMEEGVKKRKVVDPLSLIKVAERGDYGQCIQLLEDKKTLLSKYIGEKLYSFSIDNAETDFRNQIDYLIDNDLVNVIEKIQT